VLEAQGKYEAAETMHWRALELIEKVLGLGHPDTLTSVNNLAVLLVGQGKLGPKHPDTLTSMDNLAAVFGDQDKYQAAEEMHRRVLELREKGAGPRAPGHADKHEQPR